MPILYEGRKADWTVNEAELDILFNRWFVDLADDKREELKRKGRTLATIAKRRLVNSFGQPWTGDGFGTSFSRVRDHAGIVHIDPDTGVAKKKHIHDLRGTFCTKLILAGLNDHEAAEIMAWSPEQAAGIRRCYVDQRHVVVAIGERLRGKV